MLAWVWDVVYWTDDWGSGWKDLDLDPGPPIVLPPPLLHCDDYDRTLLKISYCLSTWGQLWLRLELARIEQGEQ